MHAAPRIRIPVGVLGSTGAVGQRFCALLAEHPWFEVVWVAASGRSAGKAYGEATRWMLPEPIPPSVASLRVRDAAPSETGDARIVFSALDASVAGAIEHDFAAAGALVVSNAKSHRMDPDVPLLVPEVNPGQLDLLSRQAFERGGIVTNPNCSTIGLVLALKPLHDLFGVKSARAVTLQAISGAGLPGVAGAAMLDNVIPFIAGEEEKMAAETRKILGDVTVTAQCNRVPVLDGHLVCASVELEREASADDVVAAWRDFRAAPQELELPSAPAHPTIYLDEPDAPQPRLHRDLEGGMACTIGRLQPDPLADWRFVALSHNTLRGAAGGAILCAELAVARGLV